jgi:hypothetical protein
MERENGVPSEEFSSTERGENCGENRVRATPFEIIHAFGKSNTLRDLCTRQETLIDTALLNWKGTAVPNHL